MEWFTDTVFVLENEDGNLAKWGTNKSDTGVIAFATPAEAEQFSIEIREVYRPYEVRRMRMSELVAQARTGEAWTHLWTRGARDQSGLVNWYATPIPKDG
jgi:hypothetical protein